MIIEIRHLRLVAAVAEHGSLTRAGRELHLTQSALSHQLIELEGRLRTPLFLRMGKRMVPTVAGLRLLEAARDTLPTLLATEEALRRIANGRDSLLRLSTECYTCYHWLPSVLERFRERFPRVDVEVVADATRYPVPALLEGRIDLAIAHTAVSDDRLTSHPLFADELCVITATGHRLASRSYVRAEDFTNENVVMYAMRESESTLFQEVLIPAGVRPARVTSIQITEGIIELVKAGHGVAVLARWAVKPHLDAGTLRAVRLTRNGLHRQWSAITVRQPKPPEYLGAFTELLAAGPAMLDHGRPAA